jgi:tetratricopeptide (TPR) repeat protein
MKLLYEQAVTIFAKLTNQEPKNPYLFNSWAALLWNQGKLTEGAEKYAQALQSSPKNQLLLSNDMELAWVQGDTARCHQRIVTLEKLLQPGDARHSIVRFYDWLLQPEESWQPVLNTIERIGEGKRIGWDFWATIPKVKQLPDRPRQAAEAFIEYFEFKIDLKELQRKLENLPQLDVQQQNGEQ